MDRSTSTIYPDGRGITTEQCGSRKTFFLPRNLSEQVPNFQNIENWQKLKIDDIDCENISPVVAQLMARIPGRDIPYPRTFSISRATGLPTLQDSLYAIDHHSMIRNSLWSEWSSYQIDNQPGWLQQWAYENRQDIYEDPQWQSRAFRAWKDRLSGESNIQNVFSIVSVEGLGDSIRERIAMVLKNLRLRQGHHVQYPNEDGYLPIYFAKQALSNLEKTICNEDVTRRIHDFLASDEPYKMSNGDDFDKFTPLFGFTAQFSGKTKKKKCMDQVKKISADILSPQDVTAFVEFDNPPVFEALANIEYQIAPIVTAEHVGSLNPRRPQYMDRGTVLILVNLPHFHPMSFCRISQISS